MVTLTFNVHLPLLRTSETSIPFLGGTLWQMPFETFNGLTSGAFESHQPAYEQTRPVFFNFEMEVPETEWINEPGEHSKSVMELKLPTNELHYKNETSAWYPFNIFHFIHDEVVDRIWEALILAIPTGQFVQPRHSITFINADNNLPYFKITGDNLTSMANFRGDADVEYLFMPEAYGGHASVDLLITASDCYTQLKQVHIDADLEEALRSLKTATLPYITAAEQFTICMAALENLMIPEVYEDIRKTFSHRIAALLSSLPEAYAEKFELCKTLYTIRSQAVHGQETKDREFSVSAESLLLLSSCIRTLCEKIMAGEKIAQVLSSLDDHPLSQQKAKTTIHPAAVINSSHHKLLGYDVSFSGSIHPGAQTASANENTLLYWSPLAGMETTQEIPVPSMPASFTFLGANDIISLEDKDIRRDFMAKITMTEISTAAICLSYDTRTVGFYEVTADSDILNRFENIRNLVVTGLRLAGFKKFIDPELLGNFMYKGNMRYRQRSVLRQSVYMDLCKEPAETLLPEHKDRVLHCWDLLANFHYHAYSPDIAMILNLYRKLHESRYMPMVSRAGLSFTVLEKMLGPFRSKNERIQLEDLVYAAVGKNEVTKRFRERGRKMRNSIAHGHWDAGKNETDFLNVLAVLDQLLPAFVDTWINKPADGVQTPQAVFTSHCSLQKK